MNQHTSLPDKVFLGYRTWSLEVDPQMPMEDYGNCQVDRNAIRINPHHPATDQVNAVIHELLHAAMNEHGSPLGSRTEENVVTVLANSLTELWARNPRLVRWIENSLRRET